MLTIRAADITDLRLIQRLSLETFNETFALQNTAENMQKFLDTTFNQEAIEKELADTDSYFFICYYDDEESGYMKLGVNGLAKEREDLKALEIERIYVLKKFHNKKAGAAMMQHAIGFAKQNDFEEIVLGVWEKNEKAISFYERWGFEKYGSHIFMVGDDAQNDLLMRRLV